MNPQSTHTTPLLTAAHACDYLLLTTYLEPEQAKRALDRLVDRKLIRPTKFQKRRVYFIEKLNRFIREQTEQYGSGSVT